MSLWKIGYTCDDLGVCQSRTPPCSACPAGAKPQTVRRDLPTPTLPIHNFPFAPGVIDGYPKPENPAATKWLVRWVWFTLGLTVVCFALGYLP